MATDMASIERSVELDPLAYCILDTLPESSFQTSVNSLEGVEVGEFADHIDVGDCCVEDVELSDCLNFVTESECGGAGGVDVECLDFERQGDCGESEVTRVECEGGRGGGGGGGGGGDVEVSQCMGFVKSESLGSLDVPECGDVLEVSESLDSVHGTEVGEEEALLLAEVAKASDGGSASDSGECSSGEKKDNQSSSKSGKNAAPGKKKAKVDWTPELHRRFVHAVEQLGVEKAFPSRILELMGVQCLTRHNIASHLQKYRSHRRHLAAREAEAASWSHRRPYNQAAWPRSRRDGLPYLVPLHTHTPHIQPRPTMAIPAMQAQLGQPHHQMQTPLKVWGYPTVDHSSVHMWQQPAVASPSFWQAPDGSYWQHPAASYEGFAAAPACYPHPMRVPMATMPAGSSLVAPGFPEDSYYGDEALPVSMYLCNNAYDSDLGRAAGAAACSKPTETHLSKEILDAAISEALANPWTPPPLGLKPPSMEGVIAELQRQGINTVPPSTC